MTAVVIAFPVPFPVPLPPPDWALIDAWLQREENEPHAVCFLIPPRLRVVR